MFAPRKVAWKPNNRVSKKTVLFNTCNSSVSCWFSQSFPQYSNFTAENYILNPALHFSAGKTDKSLLDNMFLHIINHHPSHTIFPPGVNIKPQTHRPWFIRTVLLKYFDIFKNLLQWYTLPIQQPLDAGIPQFFWLKSRVDLLHRCFHRGPSRYSPCRAPPKPQRAKRCGAHIAQSH